MKEVVEQAEKLISSDNKEEFTSFLRSQVVKEFAADDDHEKNRTSIPLPLQSELFMLMCNHGAVGCARALLEEVGDQVNMYEPLEGVGYSPLQLAARSLSYGLCKLFLNHYHGLQVGRKRDVPEQDILPLSLALDALCEQKYVNDWTPAQSTYKLFRIFCYPALREATDTIELLAWKEDQIERVGFDCVDRGNLAQFSALLFVAWDKFVSPDFEYMGSSIYQHISKGRRKVIDYQISLNQLWMMEVMDFLDINLHVIQRYRNSEEVKFAPKHFMPDDISSKLEFERDMYMIPENFNKLGLDGLPTQLLPEEKTHLENALDNKMDSEPTSVIGPICFKPRSPWEHSTIYSSDEEKYLTLEDMVDYALGLDNQEKFVEAIMKIKSVYNSELAKSWGRTFMQKMFEFDSINCANAVIRGDTAEVFDFDGYFQGKKMNLLHYAASIPAPRLTKLFLERGFATDARCDYDEFNLKEALPLNVALANIRANPSIRHWPATNSVNDLVAELCSINMRGFLETVRLLAEKTLGLKTEFLNYLNEGRIIELCALLIVAYKQLDSVIHQSNSSNELSYMQAFHGTRRLDCPKMTPSLTHCDSGGRMGYCTSNLPMALDKSENVRFHKGIPSLFNIFSKIGDQLGAYVQLEDVKFKKDNMVEVAWLMENGGLLVNRNREVAKVASSVSPMEDLDKQRPFLGCKVSIPSKMPQQTSTFTQGFHTQARREFHSSSTGSRSLIGGRYDLHPFNRCWCYSILKVLRKGSRYM